MVEAKSMAGKRLSQRKSLLDPICDRFLALNVVRISDWISIAQIVLTGFLIRFGAHSDHNSVGNERRSDRGSSQNEGMISPSKICMI